MPEHIRSLIVILFLSSLVWLFLKKATAGIISKNELSLWRNTWFAITLFAFLSHNFWLFIILTTGLLLYVAKREQNRFALYAVLVAAVPTINARIPGLLDITYIRVLSLVLFFPLMLKSSSSNNTPSLGKPISEKLILSFMLLFTLLNMRGTTVTDAMRYGLYGVMDYFLPYYAASRVIKDFEQLKKTMIAVVIGCMLAGTLGAMEWLRGWLLYGALPDALKIYWDMGLWLTRGDSLRAMSSLGHALALGFYMMIGFSFYLFVGKYFKPKIYWLIGLGVIIAGLLSPVSRGPWLGTVVAIFAFIAFGPKIFKRFSLSLVVAIIGIQSLYWIPGGEKIINLLPFIGNVDKFNVEYRELLLERSILVIQQYPLFGVFDATSLPEMRDLVQGQGIVDITNSYLGIALGSGLVGLFLYVGALIATLVLLRKSMKKIKDKKSDAYLCGRSLMAAMIASLFTISTVAGIGIIPTLYWSIAGLIFSYARVTKQSVANSSLKPEVVARQLILPSSRLRDSA